MSFESMPRQDLLLAIDSLAQEKMIDKETVIESVETAGEENKPNTTWTVPQAKKYADKPSVG